MASKVLTLLAAGAAFVAVAGTSVATEPTDPIEARFRTTIATLTADGLRAEVVDYQRGATDAQAVTQWEVGEGEEKVALRMSHRLRPGPAGSPAIVEVETRLVLPAEVQEQLAPFFGEQPPLTIASRLGADGRQQHQFRVLTYEGVVEGRQVQWAGAQGEAEVDGNLTRVSGTMTAPRLSVNMNTPDTQDSLLVTNARLDFTYHRPSPDAPWLGEFQVGLDEVVGIQSDDPSSNFSLAKPALTASLEEKDGSLTAKIEARVERVAAADLVLEDLGFGWAVRGIDAAAYRTLQKHLAQAAQQAQPPEETERVLNAVLLQLLPSFLARSPEIELTRLGGKTPEGATELTGRIRYTGRGDVESFAIETDLEADWALRVPEALILRLANAMKAAGEDGTAEVGATPESIAAQTQMLVDTGLLRREDGALVSRLELKGGKLTINGQPADGLFAPDGPFGAAIADLAGRKTENAPGDALHEEPPEIGAEPPQAAPDAPAADEPQPPVTTRTHLQPPPADRQAPDATTQAVTLPSPSAAPATPAVQALRRSAADRQGQGDYLGALQAYRESQAAAPDPQVADRIKRLETYLKLKGIEVPPAP